MAELNQNVTILLDRLYNLKGEDNVLIREAEEKIEETLAKIANIETTISGAQKEQAEREQELSVFLQQKSLFETAFEGITNETFSALSKIDVNLEMGTLLTQVQEKSPAFIQSLTENIEGIKKDIINYNLELDASNNELFELRQQLVVCNEQRAQLISLLEQSLSNEDIERESLTASFVKRVLASFDVFTPEEVAKLTKMIMFPEDGLYEYDKGYEDRLAKGLIGFVEAETPTVSQTFDSPTENTGLEISNPTVGEPISLEESGGIPSILSGNGQITLDLDKIGTLKPIGSPVEEVVVDLVEEEIDVPEEVIAPPVVPVVEIKDEDVDFEGPAIVLNFQQIEEADLEKGIITGTNQPIVDEAEEDLTIVNPPVLEDISEGKDDVVVTTPIQENKFDDTKVRAFLERINIDVTKFQAVNVETLETILKKISEADEELVERNYEVLRSINLEEEAYKMRFKHMYLTDTDFNKKITLLRAKNISENKIKSMIKETNSGLRVSFEEMEKRIQAVENLQGKLDENNIYMIWKDASKYEENIDTLLRYGIDIDSKESRNHAAILFESLNIPANAEILKNYIISILKSNGKYALSVFWKKPEELLADIDALVEAGLENVIATHPEILGMTASSIIKRVKWCEDKGYPVFSDDMRSEPCAYIMNVDLFKKEFNYPMDLPELVSQTQTNDSLIELIGNSDYIEILMNTLDDFYKKTESYATPEVVDSMKEHFEELCHYLEDHAKAELTGKYTYKVDGVCICKNKVERNIAIILNTLAAANQPILGVEREIVLVSALYNSGLTEEELKKVAGSCLGFNQAAQEVKL